MRMASSDEAGGLWFGVGSQVEDGTELEVFGGTDTAFQDERVVDFSDGADHLPLKLIREPYAPLISPIVLGEFVVTFGSGHFPTDMEVDAFYGRFGNIGDRGWQERLPDTDREELPDLTQLGLREPVWWARELAAELEICCELYWGLRENRIDILRATLGRGPSSGRLVDVMLLGGRLKKVHATESDLRRKVGSIGDWEETAADRGRPLTPAECLDFGRRILSGHLNRYEARAQRQWVQATELPHSDRDEAQRRRPKPPPENPVLTGFRTVIFPDLITALYLQLSDAAERGRHLRRCNGCDRFLFADHRNQQYCSTRCSNAHRRREFTARQQEKQGAEDGPDAR